MATIETSARRGFGRPAYDGPIIDCDVHNSWASEQDLLPYLEPEWREYVKTTKVKAVSLHYPFAFGTNKQFDTYGPNGEPPGSSRELLREQLLDGVGVTHAILQYDVGEEMAHRNPF